ncbi:MAG: U32 family peptidase [Lachnospiraceae bacterium]|nr:U32 family peptidase [Lachnospiraceae bacterium]
MKSLPNKPELLAPAGSFRGFIGALNGGADAVYLAGGRFGARAYADNFTDEEIKEALFLAEVFGIKVYLTVNTLLKNKELDTLYDYLHPMYEMGLTGVIVQDFGVLQFVREHFPGLEIHASTQMTVTSTEGAKYLQENGVKRVVLSRELTLDEVRNIVDAGIETECFIHGSMCYCYSGQCLFSSLIGGRSGNRGRCAQPCRLPYHFKDTSRERYCLSLKDMCTLENIPELIQAGIASFKIEGRMKNPAYAARVTQIYRKYIDLYYEYPERHFKVDSRELEQLKTLYIRSELHEGYYHQYRGRNMITPKTPAYSKTDENYAADITARMIDAKPRQSVYAEAKFVVGEPAEFTLKCSLPGKETYGVTVYGDVVQEAVKAPLSKESISERLCKTGDSYFEIKSLSIQTDDNVFMPVKSINDLRRKALDALCNKITEGILIRRRNKAVSSRTASLSKENAISGPKLYAAFTETKEQYKAVLGTDYISRIVIPYTWINDSSVSEIKEECNKAQKELFLSLPAICRNESYNTIQRALDLVCQKDACTGVYVNQIDSMAFVIRNYSHLKCIGDINLYAMNRRASQWITDRIDGYTLPVELNKDELRHQTTPDGELILYGRTPLMQTANCLFLTEGECRHNKNNSIGTLTDRKNAQLPYKGHCEEAVCYNTIYNSVVTSLHKQKRFVEQFDCNYYQLRFTFENREETKQILDLYDNFRKGMIPEEVSFAYTNGHFMRGVQ